jgi:REP element-mobilizing transposase RayT
MIYAYHAIFGTYGFWLPNDPRGSWSEFVASYELYLRGRASTVSTRSSLAHVEHNRSLRLAAKKTLLRPEVNFSGIQARAVGRGFAENIKHGHITVWACSIMPQHVHMVIARHASEIETLVNLFKGEATKRLIEEEIHPFNGQAPCWARRGWNCFLDSEEAILQAIRYVEENPLKEGKRRQRWPFVTKYPNRYHV